MTGREEVLKECVSSAGLLAAAVAYIFIGLQYPIDSLVNPGPGAFPRAVGLLLAGLVAAQLARYAIRLWRLRRTRGDVPAEADPLPMPWSMVAALVAYVLLMPTLGFVTASFALSLFCTRLMGTDGWVKPLALSMGLVIACHVLFSVWLHVPLPRGLLG